MSQFETREYQDRAAAWLSVRKRGIVQSAAGSGKTRIVSLALNSVITKVERTRPVKIGWIAPTIETRNQGEEAMAQFPAVAAQDIKIECAQAETDWSDRDILIVDEMQFGGSNQWSKQIKSCQNCRWGVSATPWVENDDERNKAVSELFDNQVFVIKREEVAHKLVPAIVYMNDHADDGLQAVIDEKIEKDYQRQRKWWKGEDWELRAVVSWNACIKLGIVSNKSRNDRCIYLSTSHAKDHVLMLVNEIEHGEFLSSKIPNSKLCFSKMGKKNRREVLESFKSGELNCVVSTSLADIGLDVPICNVIVLVSGGRNEAKTIQRVGRAQRLYPGKTHAIIYDFTDEFAHPLMFKHAKKRMSVYRELGYQVIMPGESETLL